MSIDVKKAKKQDMIEQVKTDCQKELASDPKILELEEQYLKANKNGLPYDDISRDWSDLAKPIILKHGEKLENMLNQPYGFLDAGNLGQILRDDQWYLTAMGKKFTDEYREIRKAMLSAR